MSAWDTTELARIDDADELEISSYRQDRSLRRYIPIWMVAVHGRLYVRSAGGVNRWYRNASASQAGRIRVAGREYDVRFAVADDAPHAALDAAYHRKYDRYGPQVTSGVLAPESHKATLRVEPLA
jgi:hypothetical protein